ncbi:hypothetical protein Pcinc_004260 [Petrolisthes cinctipes]|uniref:Bromodomain adjacent to zinc finger domain protein 1A n=1 Tax=Petrolisthes cinctipes TaxID=88211 RepID=A0AAE1L1P4_PETCI|nr:hypothetical protein Pcinc_004260 [Petrolisthes cinctipes]
MLWTCEVTGRPNLTYAEAAQSEARARKSLANIPKVLRRPVLYITSLTRRGRYIDLNEDVFNYVRDRYFVGEEVEAIVKNHWYDCKVIRQIMPTKEEIEKYEREMEESEEDEEEEKKSESKTNGMVNGRPADGNQKMVDEDDDDDIMIIMEVKKVDKKDTETKKKKKEEEEQEEEYPPFATVKYEVIETDPWDYKECKKHIVTWEQIRRNKGVFTREKCKLFLKQAVQLSPSGFWVLKEKVIGAYKLKEMQYSNVFVGDPPKFRETPSKKLPVSLNPMKKEATERKKRERKEAREKGEADEEKKKGRPPMSEEEREAKKKLLKEEKDGILREKGKLREELKQRLEKEKEERKKEREIIKEERRLQQEYIKEWRRAREDLDCEDHKDLPSPTPVQCRIPDASFGDFMMLLEFINIFYELLELRDVYPQGISFEMLEYALMETEVADVLNDVLQLLVQAIFTLQQEEDDEAEECNHGGTSTGVMESEGSDVDIQGAVHIANQASTWSQRHLGQPLQQAPLDALTLTEILRIHILASGATNVANSKWRHFNRGGYNNRDDPGLELRFNHPALIKSLATTTIFELSCEDKLRILSTLMAQILTYASVRDIIDDNIEKLREMKNKLRLHQLAQIRKEKEENAAKLQAKRDEKQMMREKLVKEAEKAAALETAVEGGEAAAAPREEDEEEDDDEEEDESERAARQEKQEKNKEARKQDYLKKERELLQQLLSMAKGVNMTPLGQDRAYRRYWLFNSLPGLFVEDAKINPGCCCPTPTPLNSPPFLDPSDPDHGPISALRDLFRHEKR